MRLPFRVARGRIRWLLQGLGAIGIAMPWGRTYLLADCYNHQPTRRLELVHLRQIRRDGPVRFTCRYLWWPLRYGYRDNPYEGEAYAAERAYGSTQP